MSYYPIETMSQEEYAELVTATPYKVNVWDRRGFYAEESVHFASREDAIEFALSAKAGKVAMVFHEQLSAPVAQVFQVGRHMYD